MTAIAYRDGILATDSACGGERIFRGIVKKIGRSPWGTIGAASGLAGTCASFRRLIESGFVDDWLAELRNQVRLPSAPFPIKAERNEFGAIIVENDGTVTLIDWQGLPIGLDAPFHVEGSAEEILLGAMAAGASAKGSVSV